MKLKLFLATMSLGLRAFALTPATVPVEAKELFVPVGFDDNDEIVVTLDGYLPSSCYQVANVEIVPDLKANRVLIQQKAYHFDGPCLQVPVPFTTTLSIGTLPPGDYTVATRDGKLAEKLVVNAATKPGPDDYLYAPVDSARVSSLLPEPGYLAVIEGRLTNTCLSISDVRVVNSGKTIELLPVMEATATELDGSPCKAQEVPYVRTKRLPPLSKGRHLLHVRGLNGSSVNAVFSIK